MPEGSPVPPDGEVLAVVVARGHPAVRARHDRTLELTGAPDIGPRATCVIGVGARLVSGSLDGLAGPLAFELAVDGVSPVRFSARANPAYRGGAPPPGLDLVVRRSRNRLDDTLATESDLTASALPADLVARLRDAACAVRLTVARQAADEVVHVLLRAEGSGPVLARARAEVAAGAALVAEDEEARAWATAAGLAPAAAGARAPRTLHLAGAGRPGVVGGRAGGPARVEVVGLAPAEAVVAALGPGAWLDLTTCRADELAGAMGAAPPWCGVVVRGPVADLRRRLEGVGVRRERAAVVADRPGRRDQVAVVAVTAVYAALDEAAEGERAAPVVVALGPEPGVGAGPDAAVLGLVGHLAAAGVPTGTLARALAASTGVRRNQAWDLVQARRDAADADADADDGGAGRP